jgi:hypothetical protein
MSWAPAGVVIVAILAQAPAQPARPQPPPARPAAPAPTPAPQPAGPSVVASLFPEEAAPTEALLGVALYPGAQFLTSYDGGRGQRYYLYGSAASFTELQAYYRTLLKQKGSPIFEAPPTWIFEIGKYDENSMSFPPSVTVKDYTVDGNGGYLNPKPGASPQRFPTIIQIVPPAPAPARR